LTFRYAVAANSRPCDVLINGVNVGNVPFTSTTSWTTWKTVSITKALKAGNNTIRVLASTSAGGPNLDKLNLVVGDACPSDPNKTEPGMCGCGVADIDSDKNGILDCLETSDELSHYRQEDCRDLGSINGDSVVPYYRVRIEYVSSCNWSTLKFAEPQKVYKVRTMSTSGVATKALAEYDGITVNQTSSNASAGKKITVIADYALRPAAINAPLLLKLGKGTTGSSTIRVSTIVNGSARLIHDVTHTREAQIQVDLSSLKGVSPTNAPIAKVRRMAFALYYPWYELSRWDSKELKDKPLYPYDSSDPVAIKRQITQAKTAGIDGFISSWWGPGSKTDRNMAIVLDVASQNNFFIGMFVETNSIIKAANKNWSQVENELVRWLEFYVTEHGDHPAAMKVDGKPLIVPWVTCTVPVATWKNVRSRMKAHNLEATILADCKEPEYFDVFDGAIGTDANTGRIIRYHALLADSPSPKIWMSNAMPGFDERLIEGRVNPRYYDREDGQYFKRQLNTALEASPQWIRLYTWNEYPENTHIEPSKNFGDKYLKIAGEYVLPWKCQK
ncbi:MAG: hypothetical protein MUC50_21410, partial [Myxococcota bacterium]|jgi:hypothetical protein|nr:hypothetical protein [Myxococcota bacterium]